MEDCQDAIEDEDNFRRWGFSMIDDHSKQKINDRMSMGNDYCDSPNQGFQFGTNMNLDFESGIITSPMPSPMKKVKSVISSENTYLKNVHMVGEPGY